MKLKSVWSVVVALVASSTACAQYINSWTKPTSGYWEEPYWTFGVPTPEYNYVAFTNAGWKALAIGWSTVRDYPDSVRLKSLVVRSPTNSLNTLLLNYAGLQTPLQVEGGFTLGSNSVFLTLASALRVGDRFWIDGTVNHGAGSEVSAGAIHVGSLGGGFYHLSNGVLTASNVLVGHWNSSSPRCAFRQEGGLNRLERLEVRSADYSIYEGDLVAGTVNVVGEVDGLFYQAGGRVSAGVSVTLGHDLVNGGVPWGFGRYILAGGTLNTPRLEVGTEKQAGWGVDGRFEQSGGSNFVGTLRVGEFSPLRPDYVGSGRYDLSGGTLVTSTTTVGGGLPTFFQSGGSHTVNSALVVEGYYSESAGSPRVVYGHYGLHGGRLAAQSVRVRLAGIQHSIGTNEIAGDLVLEQDALANGWYTLDGGRVVSSNTVITGLYEGRFHLSSGVHQVRNLLELHAVNRPAVRYMIEDGGQLIVRDIRLSTNAFFRHWGGTVEHSGTLMLEGATWESPPGEHRLGTLRLSSNLESTLFFRDHDSALRLARSSAEPWHPDARLIILHWGGTTAGWPRVYFGTNSSGLTSRQIEQVRFRDPYVWSSDRPAHIRSTGEVVPVPADAAVSSSLSGNRMVLRWPADFGFTLETATNIAGPFIPIVGATSPHTNQVAGPSRFFRLRR